MHDPETLFFRVKFYIPRYKKRRYSFEKKLFIDRTFMEVWYVDPSGYDKDHVLWREMGKVRFFFRNFKDMEWKFRLVGLIKSKFKRCAECGGLGGKKNPVNFGYMSSDDSYHEACMALRSCRSSSEEYLEALARLNPSKQDLLDVGMSDKDSATWRCTYAVEKWREKNQGVLAGEQ